MLRTENYTVTADGRDKGKLFVITEMPARAAHRWASRMLFAVMNSGGDVPSDLFNAGVAGLAAIGIQAITNVPFEQAEPLLDQLLNDCVLWVPDPSKQAVTRPLRDDAVEDAATLFDLQYRVIALHVGDFMKGGPSTSESPKETETAAS